MGFLQDCGADTSMRIGDPGEPSTIIEFARSRDKPALADWLAAYVHRTAR
jgi:hypothetical protein